MDGIDQNLQSIFAASGFLTPSGVSPTQSGSSKRKSRPVKRILPEVETEEEAGCAMNSKPSETLLVRRQQFDEENHSNRDDDEVTASEVQSTASDDIMDQSGVFTNSDLLRKFAEAIAANQAQQADSIVQATSRTPELSPDSQSFMNGLPTAQVPQISPLFTSSADTFQSPERILQSMITPQLNLGFTNSHPIPTITPSNGLLPQSLINANTALLQSLMAAAVKNDNRTFHGVTNAKNSKRRLFADEERARAEASSLNVDERIDMSDLEAFAQTFKKQRIKFGFTQGDVGVALGKRYGTDFSQTTISRFEALNLSFKNMCKLRPLLKEWLADIEQAIEGGASINELIDRRVSSSNVVQPSSDTSTVSCIVGSQPSTPLPSQVTPNRNDSHVKRRRKRTNLDLRQRNSLDAYFALNPRPDHDRMTEIANNLELERDVVRVWFCNRRQKMRRVDEPIDEVSGPTITPLFSHIHQMTALEQLKEAAKLNIPPRNDESDGASTSPDATTSVENEVI